MTEDTTGIYVWVALAITTLGSIVGAAAGAVQWFLGNKTEKNKTAYDQLSQLFGTLQAQIEVLHKRNNENESEITALEAQIDKLREATRQARLSLIDSKQFLRDIRNFIRLHEIDDREIEDTLKKFEAQLEELGSQLQ